VISTMPSHSSRATVAIAVLVAAVSLGMAGGGQRPLGPAEAPVIVLDHLTETQKRAYIIADNQLALNAGWNDDILGIELAALQEEDFNLDLIGFWRASR